MSSPSVSAAWSAWSGSGPAGSRRCGSTATPSLESDVAVKALADNWAQRLDVRERFLEEARILRRADSDHIVRVYDVGEVDATPYFVMTYADRGTVAGLTEDGRRFPLDQVVDLVAQAGAGLSVLHDLGIVHRDVKPQNLLLRSSRDGTRVLVADLGVAKAMLHASGLTQVVGSPAYMAPEQVSGTGIDRRADVHALAAVAYRLLTGRLARSTTLSDLLGASLPVPPSSVADAARRRRRPPARPPAPPAGPLARHRVVRRRAPLRRRGAAAGADPDQRPAPGCPPDRRADPVVHAAPAARPGRRLRRGVRRHRGRTLSPDRHVLTWM